MQQFMKAVCLLLVMLILTSCGTPAGSTVPETTVETKPTIQPTTNPTIHPTTEPTTESTIEPTEPPVVLHSGLREDGTFDEGTLFMGDSLTHMLVGSYLTPRKLIGDAKHAAMCGTPVTVFFDDAYQMRNHRELASSCSEEYKYMAFYEVAAAMGEQATAIYFMWGTNYDPNATADTYIKIVEFLLENCPNATIHMQLIPWGKTRYRVTNEIILEAYTHFKELGEQRVLLIDTYTAIGQNPIDDVHQGDIGNGRWYKALLSHAEENNLVQ